MTALIKVVDKIDDIYHSIDASLRSDLETILYQAAQSGKFEVVLEQHNDLFDKLRLANFFEMPLGFKLKSANVANGDVQSSLLWGTVSVRNSSLVTDLIAQSVENFESHLTESEQQIFNRISQKIDENNFFENTEIPVLDEEAFFVEEHAMFFRAFGYRIKFGLGKYPEIVGRAQRKYAVRFLTVY